jgi:sporulation and spore germination protein
VSSGSRIALVAGLLSIVAAVGLFTTFMWTTRWSSRATTTATMSAATPPPAAPAAAGRKIKARLFYIAEGGTKLRSIERDVAFGESAVEQAREIISAQIAPVVEPLVSAVPPGTTLRAVFITAGGDAYVDLSRDVIAAHPGGTINELLSVYTLVNALTENLPVVTAVQVLVDGREVDTLAGHVDLRRPLAKNLSWVE